MPHKKKKNGGETRGRTTILSDFAKGIGTSIQDAWEALAKPPNQDVRKTFGPLKGNSKAVQPLSNGPTSELAPPTKPKKRISDRNRERLRRRRR